MTPRPRNATRRLASLEDEAAESLTARLLQVGAGLGVGWESHYRSDAGALQRRSRGLRDARKLSERTIHWILNSDFSFISNGLTMHG